ncbi:MAG: site-specific tyrosine recombinase XerC [Burkholderiales bacterium]|nr:site-specific tyrosine recombinase XerC [Burkholderiales bacterium]
MSKRPGKQSGPLHVAGDPSIVGGFRGYLVDFLGWTAAMQYAAMTVKARRIEMGYFIDWCEERGVQRPDEVTRAMLERYRQHVFLYRTKAEGAPLSFQTQSRRLGSVRAFFQWMARQHHLLYNPASELELPKQQQRLPRDILRVAEVEQVLNACDTTEPTGLGLRDRAMLEALYSTGMRRSEVAALRVDDVDLNNGTVFVRLGKGGKDRVVPIGERACRWIEKYVFEVRPGYIEEVDEGTLFLAKHGHAMDPKQLSNIVKKVIEVAQLERFKDTHPNAACHLLRHACATHMLENGADIRYIQALLGHASLSTTEVYTRVSIMQLKAVHDRTHPARLHRRGSEQGAVDGGEPADEGETLLRALDDDATAEAT